MTPVIGIADPMIPLLELQRLIDDSPPEPGTLDEDGFAKLQDQRTSGCRYSYVKIVSGEVQALAIFGTENSINGIPSFSIGYAVAEKHRGRGLALEAVKKGIGDLKSRLPKVGIDRIYIEAVIANTNLHSIEVARRIFSTAGRPILEVESLTPSLQFLELF